MSEDKYSNNVRVIEELKKISDAPNQKKQAIKSSKKAATAALGSVVLNTPVVSSIKEKIESKINKIPFSDNMVVGTNKIGLKLGGETYSGSFTVNKDGNANLKLSKSFTENLKTELSADKDKVNVGLKLTF
jgi:vacuolar-type H+-ATPase subunit E/Vma4|tara:strand:+ start:54 stop:446 length:393 start_codon:yes stop_codon:yes gene_type:complete